MTEKKSVKDYSIQHQKYAEEFENLLEKMREMA